MEQAKGREGMVIIAPITSTYSRNPNKQIPKTCVPIPSTYTVKGHVIVEQVRTVDLKTRQWNNNNPEILSENFVDQVVEILSILLAK